MYKKTIHIMSGNIASGKTTYAKLEMAPTDKRLSRDEWRADMREMMGSKEYFPFSSAAEERAAWIDYINFWLERQYSVYWIDSTNLQMTQIYALMADLGLLWNDNVKVILHRFNTPLEVCLARNMKREGFERVPDEVVRKFDKLYNHAEIYLAEGMEENTEIWIHEYEE